MYKLGYCKRFCSMKCDKCQGSDSKIKKKNTLILVMTCVHWASSPEWPISVPNYFIETKQLNEATAPLLHASRKVFFTNIFAF